MQSRKNRQSKQSGHSKEANKDLDIERDSNEENVVTARDD